jgi:(p)ppGpp synthase/HD superfamily hydrolase
MSLSSRFLDAFAYAARLHAAQQKKGASTPYLAHLMSVTALVLDDGGTEEEAIGALLHDAVEDQGGRGRLDDIRERFGPEVAAIVEGCSDSFTTPKPPWIERKRAYVEHARHLDGPTLRVSSADKVTNATAILRDWHKVGDRVWDRFNASREDVLWYYGSLVEAFRASGGGALTEELARVVAALRACLGPTAADPPRK